MENVGDDRSVDGCDPQAAPAGTAGAAADPARSLLRQVRDAQGSAPTSRRTRRAGGRAPERAPDRAPARGQEPGRNRGGYSGAGPDPRSDPQPVGRLLDALITDQGWDRPLADARVFAEWAQLVGADVAAHCTPQSLRDGELRIVAESTAWATQLRLLSRQLLGRLAAELGSGVVRRVSISGPVAPSWKHGNRSVRGARGPRDTYG